jgi:hypothetical protein
VRQVDDVAQLNQQTAGDAMLFHPSLARELGQQAHDHRLRQAQGPFVGDVARASCGFGKIEIEGNG